MALRPLPVRRAHWLLIGGALALAATGALAQDVELFDRPDFTGQRLTLTGGTGDLGAYGMAGRVSSAVIHRGQWEFCTQAQFRGACITAGPGRYARLPQGLNDSVASLRPVAAPGPVSPTPTHPPQPPQPPRPDRIGAGGPPTLLLFAGEFTGPELRLQEAVHDLRSLAFNDSAVSVIVQDGVWELCAHGGFGGPCVRLGPGRHLLPPELRDQVSSVRPVGGPSQGPVTRPLPPTPHPGGQPWQGARPAIVFHEHRDFSGRQVALVAPTPSFGALGFNDQASAVEIFRGRWQLCRHADYHGECRVLGPGRYTLDGGLNDAVSSARPVSGRDDRPIGGGNGAPGAVTLHDQGDLHGRALLVEDTVHNLRDLGFNDRAVAIEVHAGRWELCSDAGFRGRCEVFGPGWWRLPPGLAGGLSSLRPR